MYFPEPTMTEKPESRLLLKLISNFVKENVAKYDVDSTVRAVEMEVNTAVNQGMDLAARKFSSLTKRFSQR